MIVSLFHCSPAALRADPDLGPALRAAGVTHLEVDAVEELHYMPWCIANGWRVIAIGDNFLRTPADAAKNCTHYEVIRSAMLLQESGICDGIEMVDEMHPIRSDYPMMPQFSQWWRAAGGPPIRCPSRTRDPWEDSGLVDEYSRQWIHDSATTYKEREKRLDDSLEDLPDDGKRVTVMIPVIRRQYTKRVEGDNFQRGKDVLWNNGIQGEGIVRLTKRAVKKVGIDRIALRYYALDPPWGVPPDWKGQRRNTPIASKIPAGQRVPRLQQGIDQHDDRWMNGLAKAVALVRGEGGE